MDRDLYPAHRQAADWLMLLREEPEDAATCARFEAWLDEDPTHARAWASVSHVFDVLDQGEPELAHLWPARPAAEGTVATMPQAEPLPALREAKEPHQPRQRPGWLRSRKSAARTAGGALAAALALAWIAPSAVLYARADHMTGAGELEMLALADGSQVQLGPDSAIAVDYASGQRHVRLLAGQAWFEVERDPAAPFRVQAGDVRTTVLGTGFDVRQIGDATMVSVAHGRVRVLDQGIAPATARELTAGKWVRIDGDHLAQDGQSNPALIGAWREGRVIAHDRAIADVIDELRPWFGGRIMLANDNLGQVRMDGVYDARDPAAALRALVGEAGGTVRQITPWLIIVS